MDAHHRSWPVSNSQARAARARVTFLPAVLLGVITGTEFGMHVSLTGHGISVGLPAYGWAVLAFLSFKLGLACLYVPPAGRMPTAWEVAAIITVHNEDPGVFSQCLDAILAQTRLPNCLMVVDDGSADPACVLIARQRATAFWQLGVRFRIIEHPRNLGKREGLADGFCEFSNADVYLCVDSDTVLKADALERALAYFADPRVQAVTGCVLAANWRTNLLTRLIDLRYANAFLGERAAYSALGSVLCACGSLALYRGPVVRKYLRDFLSQEFLGKRCTYGDDRRLTYYCLREGRVLLAPDAVAWTMVPESMGHFLRQQLRWSKSFIRESWCMLTGLGPRRACWWLSALEVVTWATFTTVLVYTLLGRPLITGHLSVASYLTATLLLAYARSGHYPRADHPDATRFRKLMIFALAPVYGLVHMVLLLPLRLVALLTLRDNSWGTRAQVEVRAA
jgi:hyaluronan synthase